MSTGFVEATIDIDAPPERVWSLVVDWPRQSEWIPATQVRGDAAGSGLGTRIEAWTGLRRVGVLDPMTITAWDPPRRCEVLHTGRWLRGEGGFVVEPLGPGRARLSWWERFVLPAGPVGRLAWAAARPVVRLGLRRALAAVKRGAQE
jgi:carbon monoxide dehydrogenase subunit G